MLPIAVGFQERTTSAKKEVKKREPWYMPTFKFQKRRRN